MDKNTDKLKIRRMIHRIMDRLVMVQADFRNTVFGDTLDVPFSELVPEGRAKHIVSCYCNADDYFEELTEEW